MISPFAEKQVREGVICYGLSSYGYDLRVADEFKIFTNVNSTIVDPKNFDERSFVTMRPTLHRSAQLVCPGPLGGVFQDSARRADDLRGQIDLRPLRHHCQRHAVRAGVGGLRDPGDLKHDASARQDLCQRGDLPDYFLPVRRPCETSYADARASTRARKGSFCQSCESLCRCRRMISD